MKRCVYIHSFQTAVLFAKAKIKKHRQEQQAALPVFFLSQGVAKRHLGGGRFGFV